MSVSREQHHSNSRWLIDRMVSIGPSANIQDGICFATAHIGMQAVLANNMMQFNALLGYMDSIPLEKFKKKVDKHSRQHNKQRHLVDSSLEIKSFCEKIYTYQETDFSSSDLAPFAQFKPYLFPAQLDIIQTSLFTGSYRKHELLIYFSTLYQAIAATEINHSFSLILYSIDHVVTVGYDPEKGKWIFINSEDLLAKEMDDIDSLVEYVFSAYSSNGVVSLFTELYGLESEKDKLQALVQHWITQEACQKLHTITPEKARLADSSNQSCLHIASKYGFISTVEALIVNGADINLYYVESSNEKLNALMLAVIDGNIEMAKTLLKQGADINACLESGKTALHFAIEEKSPAVVEFLLLNGANIEKRRADDFTPLHVAAELGNTNVLDVLLKYSADVNAVATADELSPLSCAIYNSNHKIVSALIDVGAFPDQISEGWTQMMIAVNAEDVKSVKYMLHYTDLMKFIDIEIEKLLEMAEKEHLLEGARQLFNEVPYLEYVSFTALHVAAFFGYEKIFGILLNRLINLDLLHIEMLDEILHITSIMGHDALIEMLWTVKNDKENQMQEDLKLAAFDPQEKDVAVPVSPSFFLFFDSAYPKNSNDCIFLSSSNDESYQDSFDGEPSLRAKRGNPGF